jgi:hypothetical protein
MQPMESNVSVKRAAVVGQPRSGIKLLYVCVSCDVAVFVTHQSRHEPTYPSILCCRRILAPTFRKQASLNQKLHFAEADLFQRCFRKVAS